MQRGSRGTRRRKKAKIRKKAKTKGKGKGSQWLQRVVKVVEKVR
jgi:hypothetical protein